jgi:glycerol kinase
VAWTIGDKTTFMMEGLASTIGTVVNWSRNHLGIFDEEEETSAIASSVQSTEGVYFVPAFSGLGAPQSDGGARGVIVGLSATTTKAHIVRAMLEGIAYRFVPPFTAHTHTHAAHIAHTRTRTRTRHTRHARGLTFFVDGTVSAT